MILDGLEKQRGLWNDNASHSSTWPFWLAFDRVRPEVSGMILYCYDMWYVWHFVKEALVLDSQETWVIT